MLCLAVRRYGALCVTELERCVLMIVVCSVCLCVYV